MMAAAASNRTRVLGRHLSAPEPSVAATAAQQGGRHTAQPAAKFDDAAMQDFVTNGYALLQPELPAAVPAPPTHSGSDPETVSYNEMICRKVDKLQELGRDMGNNMLPQVRTIACSPQLNFPGISLTDCLVPQLPELMTLFDHPVINGALQSILGDDYYIHLHHATHTKRGKADDTGAMFSLFYTVFSSFFTVFHCV